MENYAIMRIAKIKSMASFDAISRHDREREKLPHRKHKEREDENRRINNKHYDKEMDLSERAKQRIGSSKVRKNAVVGFEVILAYSPDAAGTFDEQEWIKANCKWLSKSFGGGENVIGLFYHADESTPHLHAIVVPMVEKNGKSKLCASHYVDGKMTLSRLQDTYAEAMEPFGFQRGNRFIDCPEKPSAHHRSLREYYAEQAAKEAVELAEIKRKVFGDNERGGVNI